MKRASQEEKIFENSIHQHNVCSQFAFLSVYCLGFYAFGTTADFLLAYKKAVRGAGQPLEQLKAKQISGLP